MSAEIITTQREVIPPENVELLVEQMSGRNQHLMERALVEALARIRAGYTDSMIICEFGPHSFRASAFVDPTLSKLDVAECLHANLPGLLDTLDG